MRVARADLVPTGVACHEVTTPGNPRVEDCHFRSAPTGTLGRIRVKMAAAVGVVACTAPRSGRGRWDSPPARRSNSPTLTRRWPREPDPEVAP